MYIILLLLLFILFSYGYPTIEGMKGKDKDKDKGDDTTTTTTTTTDDTYKTICSQNQENITTMRSQIDEMLALKDKIKTLEQTIAANDTKINMLISKIQKV